MKANKEQVKPYRQGLLQHAIHWVKQCRKAKTARRRALETPYTIPLGISPSQLFNRWQDLTCCSSNASLDETAHVFYVSTQGCSFTAELEVDKWQGVFSFCSPAQGGKENVLSDMELWGLAWREQTHLPNFETPGRIHGAVFWRKGMLHVYPNYLGARFERFLHQSLGV